MARLAAAFERRLLRDGRYVVHVRRLPSHPCPACHGVDGDHACPICLGFGVRIRLAPLLVRSSSPRASADNENETALGRLTDDTRTYYCRANARPTAGDYLVEVTWTTPPSTVSQMGRALAVHAYFRVEEPEPLYGAASHVVFWRCAAHQDMTRADRLTPAVLARSSSWET